MITHAFGIVGCYSMLAISNLHFWTSYFLFITSFIFLFFVFTFIISTNLGIIVLRLFLAETLFKTTSQLFLAWNFTCHNFWIQLTFLFFSFISWRKLIFKKTRIWNTFGFNCCQILVGLLFTFLALFLMMMSLGLSLIHLLLFAHLNYIRKTL